MVIFNFARRAPKVRYYYILFLLEISRRTRWSCLKCVIVYPARDIRPFVMYCVNGKPRSSLLIRVYRHYDISIKCNNISLIHSIINLKSNGVKY